MHLYDWYTNGRLDLDRVTAWEEQLAAKREAAKDQLVVLGWSILQCQVCAAATLTREQVEQITNEVHPAGTSHGWSIDDHSDQAVVCADNPDRRHWLLSC